MTQHPGDIPGAMLVGVERTTPTRWDGLNTVAHSAMNFHQAMVKFDPTKIDRKERMPVDIVHGRGSMFFSETTLTGA